MIGVMLVSLAIAPADTLRASPESTHAPSVLASAAPAVAFRSPPITTPWLARVDTPTTRPRAIEYSDAYYTRLTIHRYGSYAMLPLFAAEYVLGEQLLDKENPSQSVKSAHSVVAGAVAVVFTVNTVTGAWNLWDSRADEHGRTRRYLHTALMLASDAGFVWTGQSAGDAKRSFADQRHHRNIALGSIGLSAAGTALMWFWKD